jgi:hypothetical protein
VRDRRLLAPALLVMSLAAMPLATPAVADQGVEQPNRVVAQILAPPTADVAAAEGETALTGQRYPWTFSRSAVDRPDERSGRLIHVVYLRAAGMPDDHYDELGILEDSVRSMNVWTKQQTGNQQWRFDTYTFTAADPTAPGGTRSVNAVDVTFIDSPKPSTSLDSAGEVEAELTSRRLNDPNKRYLSYVSASAGGVCGDAWFPLVPDATPVDGQFSQVYLYSSDGCRAREFAPNATQPSFAETIAMQEMIHNDGMVPLVAPHDCVVSLLAFGHVCTGPLWATELDPERFDVMYPYVGLPLNEKKLDEDHLDYYRHLAPYKDLEQSLYLETV